MIDWLDILFHTAAALLAAAALYWLGFAVANAVFWFFREVFQHWKEPWEVFTHPQSLLEWVAPALVGFAAHFIGYST